MPQPITLTKAAREELERLADTLGFTQEEALYYAVRLVNACVREGLLTDVPARLWPDEAEPGVCALRCDGAQGKVLAFRRKA